MKTFLIVQVSQQIQLPRFLMNETNRKTLRKNYQISQSFQAKIQKPQKPSFYGEM